MDKQQLISGLLDAFVRALSEGLGETGPEDIRVNWTLTSDPQDDAGTWTWWSGGLGTHPGAKFFVGAPEETWDKLGRGGSSGNTREDALAVISRSFAKAVEEQFGNRAAAQDAGPSGAPSVDWTRIAIEIRYPAGEWPAAACVLSPEFEAALGGPEKTQPAAAPVPSPAGRVKPSDMLMHVQVPVSVSFGATQIRMKDLLNLTTGSVVELDQALHDNVEVRVNDRVIARGEVVAVDGHYGVRVLELVSGDNPGKGIGLVTSRIAILLLISMLAGMCWRIARRAQAGRKRRLRLLEMELRLAAASEALHEEVFRLKHYRVLRPNAPRRNAGFIPSTNVSSLRYIKGRQNED